MIHKAQVYVSFPASPWAKEMQLKRLGVPCDPYDPATIIDCRKGDIRIYTLRGDELDPASTLAYEFVHYDEQRGIIVVSVFIGEDDSPVHRGFDKLFPLEHTEAPQHEVAFLIVPATPGRFLKVKAWALVPIDSDPHAVHGASTNPEYLHRLITAVGL